MTRRRRVFGPLFYATLVLAFIATAYTGFVTVGKDLMRTATERQEITHFARMLRDTHPDAPKRRRRSS